MGSGNLHLWVGGTKFQATVTDEPLAIGEAKFVRYTIDEKEVTRDDFNALYTFALAGRI